MDTSPVTTWLELGATLLPWLADASIKAMLLAGLAGIALVLLRSQAARRRHAMLALAMVGFILVPLITPVASMWQLDWLAWSATASGNIQAPAPVADPIERVPAVLVDDPVEPSVLSKTDGSNYATGPGERTVTGISFAAGLVLLWMFGVLFVLSYGGVGHLRAAWLVHRGRTIDDERWSGLARDVARELQLRDVPHLLGIDDLASPVTWGIRQPVILIPTRAMHWSAERIRLTLLHEFTHVRRRDGGWQGIGLFAAALHWPNPAVWWCVRRLAFERERACDEAVLSRGVKASTYAAHLLEVARVMAGWHVLPASTLALARGRCLERRVLGLRNCALREADPRARASFSVVGLVTALVVLSIVRLAGAIDRNQAALSSPLLATPLPKQTEPRPAPEAEGDSELPDPSHTHWMMANVTVSPGPQNAFEAAEADTGDQNLELSWTQDGAVITFVTHGRVRIDERPDAFLQFEAGAGVVIESRQGERLRRLAIERDSGGKTHYDFEINGAPTEFTEADRQWSERLLREAVMRLRPFAGG